MNPYQNKLMVWAKSWTKDPNLIFIKKLTARFPGANFYLVGGMVRDLALGRPSVDYDLVAQGVPAKQLETALKKIGRVDLVGKNFGVFKFLSSLDSRSRSSKTTKSKEAIDVALPRTEHSFGTGGYRDFQVKSDYRLGIEKDLERRDFTINAMAIQLQTKSSKLQAVLVDPFNGLEDLKNKTIRCVGQPEERFKEDYSRMLRALRLACQLDFEIEAATWKAITKNITRLNKKIAGERLVPYEVIAKELIKAFDKKPAWALELLDTSGAIRALMPELLKMKGCPQPENFHSEGDVWVHTKLALQKLESKEFCKEFFTPLPTLSHKERGAGGKGEPKTNKLKATSYKLPREVIWGLLFHDIGKPYTITMADRIRFNGHDAKSAQLFEQIAERLKLSSAGLNIETVKKIIGKHMLPTNAKIMEMKQTTIEKYFFNDLFPGQELLMLIFTDIAATVPPSGRPDYSSYRALTERIKKLSKKTRKIKLPDELLNGHEIMKILSIKPGPEIKTIKEALREGQLSDKVKNKKQARAFILEKFKTK